MAKPADIDPETLRVDRLVAPDFSQQMPVGQAATIQPAANRVVELGSRIEIQRQSSVEGGKRDRVADRRLPAARQEIGEPGEDAAGLGAADIRGDRFAGDVEQRVAGEIAALDRQVVDAIGSLRTPTLN